VLEYWSIGLEFIQHSITPILQLFDLAVSVLDFRQRRVFSPLHGNLWAGNLI
jgi:hypothetical protein